VRLCMCTHQPMLMQLLPGSERPMGRRSAQVGGMSCKSSKSSKSAHEVPTVRCAPQGLLHTCWLSRIATYPLAKAYTHLYMRTRTHMRAHAHTLTNAHTHKGAHKCTHRHIHAHDHTHTHTHTHKRTLTRTYTPHAPSCCPMPSPQWCITAALSLSRTRLGRQEGASHITCSSSSSRLVCAGASGGGWRRGVVHA